MMSCREWMPRMEKGAEQGSAIAAVVEGVERQLGSNFSGSQHLLQILFMLLLKRCMSYDLRVNSVVVMTGNKIQGILTSKDILMRLVAQNLSPELTLVEKVMTQSPECVTLETTILESLHIMYDGKFLHSPVLEKDGGIAACMDVLHITQAAISMVESSSDVGDDVANTVMQEFWDSALNLEPPDDCDTHSEMSMFQYMASEGTEHTKGYIPVSQSWELISFQI